MLSLVDLLPEDQYDRFIHKTALIVSGFLLLVTVWSIHGRVDEVLTLIGIMMGIWLMDFLFETFRPNNPRAGYYHKSAREKEKVWRRCYGKN